ELVHHRVDGVLQLEDLAAYVHRDLARKVAARHGGGHLGNVSYLRCEICREEVDVVGQILPRSGNAWPDGLTAKRAVAADFTRDARHFRCERTQLVHHRIDGFLQLEDFSANVDGDFLREVSVGDSDSNFGDVANLSGQVVRH